MRPPEDRPTASGETWAVARKKTLLRILARREAERLGLRVAEADLQATTEHFRRSYGLDESGDLARWRAAQGVSEAAFALAMHDFTMIRLVEAALAADIDGLVDDHIAVGTARLREERGG